MQTCWIWKHKYSLLIWLSSIIIVQLFLFVFLLRCYKSCHQTAPCRPRVGVRMQIKGSNFYFIGIGSQFNPNIIYSPFIFWGNIICNIIYGKPLNAYEEETSNRNWFMGEINQKLQERADTSFHHVKFPLSGKIQELVTYLKN